MAQGNYVQVVAEVYTFTKKGNKHAWLVYDEGGNGEIIATLKIPPDKFWELMGKALNIKFKRPNKEVSDG